MALRPLYRLYWLCRVAWRIHLSHYAFSVTEAPLTKHLPWIVLPQLVLDAYDRISKVL